jgi:glycosyltransferase involved in cell wall biosynthesis
MADGPAICCDARLMRVSVVIPAFNAERTLAATLRSVQRQTRPRVEVIVVDDGSTDRTVRLAEQWGARVLSKPNSGQADARNLGIEHAQGDWVTFLDADDLLAASYLQEMEKLAGTGAALLHTDAYLFSGRRVFRGMAAPDRPWAPRLEPRALFVELAARNFVFVATTVRRDALQRVGGFDGRINGVEDWEMWLRLAAHGYGSARTPVPLGMYRRRPGQVSADRQRMEAAIRRMWEIVDREYRLDDELRAVVAERRRYWELRVTPPSVPEQAWRPRARSWRHARLVRPRVARATLRGRGRVVAIFVALAVCETLLLAAVAPSFWSVAFAGATGTAAAVIVLVRRWLRGLA